MEFAMSNNIPYYVVNEPYELFYKNESTAYPVGAHTHNTAEIYLTLTALPDVLLNDSVSSVSRGTLILIPPFCVHQLYHERNVVYERYLLNLDLHWLENLLCSKQEFIDCLKQSDCPLILELNENQLSELTYAMNHVIPILNERSIKSTSEFLKLLSVIESTVHNARINASPRQTNITKSQVIVNEIITYINENLEGNITLSDISSQLYLNKDYLSRLFVKHTHTSIGRYITIQRIAKSQEYLRSGLTVAQVSEKMGFSSYAYFFKVFQKMTGLSPSQYKNTLTSYLAINNTPNVPGPQ